MPTVLILGGGFGGLAAATELRQLLPGAEVVLIDRRDSFFMGFAKLWDLAGVRDLAGGTRSLASLADRGVHFVQADITSIDPGARRVDTSAGTFAGDGLLVALGAGPPPAHQEMTAGPDAYDLYDGAQVKAIGRALAAVDGGSVLVAILGVPFKCSPAPFEAVLVVDELLRTRGARGGVQVAISTPQPGTMPVAGPGASQYVATRLAERGIELLTRRAVTGVDHAGHVVHYADGSAFSYRILLGVPAASPPPVVRGSPLAGNSGFIEPDRHTMRTAFERVYAVGDCTHVPTAKFAVPKAGVFAAAEGVVAARNLVRDLTGTGQEASFDGHGFCFLELPGQTVATVEGNFFAEPEPDVGITEVSEAQFRRKQDYEQARLATWLG
ncbi:MAG TPA: FAD-dependent oxidoreductase [Actinomycetota bacterium]|nr:FAD-dependent oxidoreductase [Actinomycetota bacterium]